MNGIYPNTRLGDICSVRIGRTPRRDHPEYWGGNAVWLTVSELDGGTLVDSKEHVSDLAVKEVMPEPIAPGTLLFSFKLSIGNGAAPVFLDTELGTIRV